MEWLVPYSMPQNLECLRGVKQIRNFGGRTEKRQILECWPTWCDLGIHKPWYEATICFCEDIASVRCIQSIKPNKQQVEHMHKIAERDSKPCSGGAHINNDWLISVQIGNIHWQQYFCRPDRSEDRLPNWCQFFSNVMCLLDGKAPMNMLLPVLHLPTSAASAFCLQAWILTCKKSRC